MTNEEFQTFTIDQFKYFKEQFKYIGDQFHYISDRFKHIDDRFKHIDDRFKHIDEDIKENKKFRKFAMEKFEKLEKGQMRLENRQEKLEKGQMRLENRQEKLEQVQKRLEDRQGELEKGQNRFFNEIADFRAEVKEGAEHTDKLINDGFKKTSENLKQLFAHEKRITRLEHQVIKMSVLLPMNNDASFQERGD